MLHEDLELMLRASSCITFCGPFFNWLIDFLLGLVKVFGHWPLRLVEKKVLICSPGSMVVWLYSSLAVLQYGCIAVWQYGCIAVWLYSSMAVWLYSSMAVWLYSSMAV